MKQSCVHLSWPVSNLFANGDTLSCWPVRLFLGRHPYDTHVSVVRSTEQRLRASLVCVTHPETTHSQMSDASFCSVNACMHPVSYQLNTRSIGTWIYVLLHFDLYNDLTSEEYNTRSIMVQLSPPIFFLPDLNLCAYPFLNYNDPYPLKECYHHTTKIIYFLKDNQRRTLRSCLEFVWSCRFCTGQFNPLKSPTQFLTRWNLTFFYCPTK